MVPFTVKKCQYLYGHNNKNEKKLKNSTGTGMKLVKNGCSKEEDGGKEIKKFPPIEVDLGTVSKLTDRAVSCVQLL